MPLPDCAKNASGLVAQLALRKTLDLRFTHTHTAIVAPALHVEPERHWVARRAFESVNPSSRWAGESSVPLLKRSPRYRAATETRWLALHHNVRGHQIDPDFIQWCGCIRSRFHNASPGRGGRDHDLAIRISD